MDKGLKLINELKIDLENLLLQQKENQNKIENLEKIETKVNTKIEILKNQLKRFQEEKDSALAAPQLYKEQKKRLFKSIVIGVVGSMILMCVVCLTCALFKDINSLFYILKVSTIGIPLLGASTFGLFLITFKAWYKTEDLSKIEELINEITDEIEENKEKQKEINNILGHLRSIELDLAHQISKLTNEKDNLEAIRTEVINDYCNNTEFDELFDKALNKKSEEQNKNIEQPKQKKKSNK